MKTNKYFIITIIVLLSTTSCTNEDLNENISTEIKQLTTFQSDSEPPTRTTMIHEVNNKGTFYWTAGDNLWVDNGSLISSSSNDITDKKYKAEFGFLGNFTANSYPVYYTGKNSSVGNQVTISTVQTQTIPNDFSHLGESGDCGSAIANKNGNIYKFQLEHKAAYLCFVPREEDVDLGKNIYLTKIVITADNNIAGTYDFSSGSLSENPFSGTESKTITLITKGNGAYANGFPLTNNTSSIEINGAYVVIAPGQHDLIIQYYLYDPTTNIEGIVYKRVVNDFKPNTITDITANLKITKVELDKYSIWDAKAHFWSGYESVQPITTGVTADANIVYPEDRVGRSPGGGHAINNCKNCPNGNELSWYVKHGDPHWDANELFSFANHLYKGGAWILKSSNITGFRSDRDPDGNDYTNRFDGKIIVTMNQMPLSYTERERYFFLPTAGAYIHNTPLGSFYCTFDGIGINGNYWSSSDGAGINNITAFGFSPSYSTPGTYEIMVSSSRGKGWGWNYTVFYIGEMGGLFQ